MTTADKPVYDIKDVEHGNKFMVRPAGGGAPQIVHNCSQALAAAALNTIHARAMPGIEALGGVFVSTVHDEIVARFPHGNGAAGLRHMLDEMEKPIPWWPELITRGEGDHGLCLLEKSDGNYDARSRYGCLK